MYKLKTLRHFLSNDKFLNILTAQNYGYLTSIYHSYKELPKKKEDIKVVQRYHLPSPISKGIIFYASHMGISFLSVLIGVESLQRT